MLALTEGFVDQAKTAVSIAQAVAVSPATGTTSVVMTGLGGSAAGGDLAAALYRAQGKVPFTVNRDYTLPSHVGPQTLVFACSYSGNTEETLSAYHQAVQKGARVIAVTSGGRLADLATDNGHQVVRVPGGQPPRTAMGFMGIPLVVASEKLGLVPPQDYEGLLAALAQTQKTCRPETDEPQNPAKQAARFLHGSLGVLYGTGTWQYEIAQRWRGQLNENSKVVASTHFFPELCHNEILGWEGSGDQSADSWRILLLRGGDESPRMNDRIRLTMETIARHASVMEVTAPGGSLLAKMWSLAHIGDWVSIYLAALRSCDPGAMAAIDNLKDSLAALPTD